MITCMTTWLFTRLVSSRAALLSQRAQVALMRTSSTSFFI